MISYLGQLAALGTALCWSVNSVLFTNAGRQVGSPVVNRTRLLVSLAFVSAFHLVSQGQALPLGAEPFRWGWLALSGVIGFVLGDAFLFQAFVMIGPRLSMLLMSLAPVFGALLAWGLLSETLVVQELVGIALTVGGVALVITDRGRNSSQLPEQTRPVVGVLMAVAGALGQAGGLVASKAGLAGGFSALSGNAIRLLAAVVVMWTFTLARGQARRNFGQLRAHPRALGGIVSGSLAGPVLGVTLSLFAVQHAPVGVASTLMSTSPIIMLPVDRLVYGSRIGKRAVGGTVLAFAGTALLFLQI